MLSIFNRKKPKVSARERAAQRREKMLARLRIKHPGWSDAKLRAYIGEKLVGEKARQRTQYDREVAELEREGNALLARMEAETAAMHARNAPRIAVTLANGVIQHVTEAHLQFMQRDIAEAVRDGRPMDGLPRSPEARRELLDEVNRIAVQHGLPAVSA